MLQIILDADTRLQVQRLIQWLSQGDGDPFVSDTLVVGDTGTGIWLQQQLALQTSITANLKIELPGRFIWDRIQRALDQAQHQSPYDPLVARWAIQQIIDAAGRDESPAPELAPMLTAWAQASERDRVVMATELANQFDRYLTYRRDWLDGWAARKQPALAAAGARGRQTAALEFARRHEPWQAWLWRALIGHITGFSSRHPFDQFLSLVQSGTDAAGTGNPPGRVAIFGHLSLSSEQMHLLALLGARQPGIWFASDPSQGFWEQILSPLQAARLAAQDPASAWLYENEPAVLGEWGRQSRDALIQMRHLEQQGLANINDDELRARIMPAPMSNLARLQAAVFELSDQPWHADEPLQHDASLEVHAMHNLSRQVDLACDRVMAAMAELPDLRPDQIVIFCTDPDAAAPLVKSAFELPALGLPVQISGQSARVNPRIIALQDLFTLVNGPAHVNAVLDWFEGPAKRAGAGLDLDLSDQLRQAFQHAGLHRDDLADAADPREGGPYPAPHGWRDGLDRLVLGMATGPLGVDAPTDLAVMPVQGLGVSQIEALEPLFELLELIRNWRSESRRGLPFQRWTEHVLHFLDNWFAVRDDGQADILQIRDALGELNDAIGQLPGGGKLQVSLAVFAQALEAHLEQRTAAARAGGAITVAPVGSLREIPFRVAVLLGMDEGKFPGRRRSGEHDLISHLPRFGDADPVSAGRGWFLQTLLNTRDRLIVTYQGRDSRGDSALNPSRPVGELLDYLRRFDWRDPDKLVCSHPLQPFSPRRFAASAIPGYTPHWFHAAQALAGADRGEDAIGPVGVAVPERSDEPVTRLWRLDELTRNLLDPARAYLQHAGGIALSAYETLLSDIEPMGLHDFDNRTLFDWKRRAAQWSAAGWRESDIREQLAREPAMPDGVAIEPVLRTIITEGARISQAEAAAMLDLGFDRQTVTVAHDEQSLLADGRFAIQSVDAVVIGQPVRLLRGPADSILQVLPAVRQLDMGAVLQVWIAHLYACSMIEPEQEVHSLSVVVGDRPGEQGLPIVFDRQSIRIWQVSNTDHASPWERLLRTAAQNQRQAPALFPRTAAAWLSRADVGEPIDPPQENRSAWDAARVAYEGDESGRSYPELARSWHAALWRDQPPSLETALATSLPFYAPIWWAMQRGEARS